MLHVLLKGLKGFDAYTTCLARSNVYTYVGKATYPKMDIVRPTFPK